MEANQAASQTAQATAYMRAAHQLLDGEPRVLDDPVAMPLLGPEAQVRIETRLDHFQSRASKALRAHVVLRSRFAEDRLADALGRGIQQYILLGAGLDTFALRQPRWAQSLSILEIDHPQTQEYKRGLLDRAHLETPSNLRFISIDFERESLRDGLLRYGVSLEVPTFFSWLGVTMYLQEPAIDAVLKLVAEFPSGSEMVLTFAQPPDENDLTMQLANRAATVGEPFVSFFTPVAMEVKLRRAGFSVVEFLSPKEIEVRYFSQRPRDLPVPRRTAIVAASV